MNDESLAELSGVSKRFGKVLALDGLNLDVRRGELLAVLGPNAAGKTTAISLMLGLQQPDAGTASLFRQPPQRLEARRQVGVMMQEVTLAEDLRVREHIDLVGQLLSGAVHDEGGVGDDAHDASRRSPLWKTFRRTKAAGAVRCGGLRSFEAAIPR